MKALQLSLLFIATLAYRDGLGQMTQKFQFQFGVGKSESSQSAVVFIEPKRIFKQGIAVGLRIEALTVKGGQSVISAAANGQYYFLKRSSMSDFHPFIGMGAGIFFPSHFQGAQPIASPAGGWYYAKVEGDSYRAQAGAYPRIGVDYGRLTLTIDYNFIYRKMLTITYYDPVTDTDFPSATYYKSDNYLSVKFGFRL
jgi:hypothetical protein